MDYLIGWAQRYNFYERLADGDNIYALLTPAIREFESTGCIPDWAGVDLLRGWASFLCRSHRWSGGVRTILEQYPEFALIIEALSNHPAAKARDKPPLRS